MGHHPRSTPLANIGIEKPSTQREPRLVVAYKASHSKHRHTVALLYITVENGGAVAAFVCRPFLLRYESVEKSTAVDVPGRWESQGARDTRYRTPWTDLRRLRYSATNVTPLPNDKTRFQTGLGEIGPDALFAVE